MDSKMNFEHCKVEVRITRSDGVVVTVDLEPARFALELAMDAREERVMGGAAAADLRISGNVTRLGGW